MTGHDREIMMIKSLRPLVYLFALFALLRVSDSFASAEAGITMARPSPSPLGDQVVFSADFDGALNLWVSSINGSTLHKLTTNPDGDHDPAWSPDSQLIAFSSRKGSAADIWVVRPDGTGFAQITAKSLTNKQPTWSADSKQLAYVSNRAGTNDIWITNLDTKSTRRLTSLPGQENHPSFSPDGTQIVFSETVGGTASLMIVYADGSGLRQLTARGTQRDWNPNWSKFGIAFSSDRGTAEHSSIWTIQPDGSNLKQIGNVRGLDPAWMPNGHLLFADEFGAGTALSAITELDPLTLTKRVVNDREGFMVGIDIRPGSSVNNIRPGGLGAIRVAILSTKDFDAISSVDQTTLTFGATGNEASFVRCDKRGKDVNRDGFLDLVCRFKISATMFQAGDTVGILRFKTRDGFPFEGRDSIKIVNDDDPEDMDQRNND